MNVEEFVQVLAARGCDPRRQGAGWIARCPAHDDQKPSLSVAVGRSQPVVLKCHAGCTPAAIAASLGQRLEELSVRRHPRESRAGTAGLYSKFEIKNVDGQVEAIHHRRDVAGEGKKMWWTLPDGTRGLAGRLVTGLPLFGAELLPILPDGALVVVAEGEKATAALLAMGIPAVGTVTGASSVPCGDALRPLVRLRPVLWSDADAPGRAHMASVGKHLRSLGATVSELNWPEAPSGADAADFIAAGGGTADVQRLIAAARPLDQVRTAAPREPVLTCLKDVEPEQVSWLWPPLVPLGKLTMLEGDPERGKTWVALAIITAITRGSGLPGVRAEQHPAPSRAIYVTAEDGIADTIRVRLDAMRADVTLVDVLEGRRNEKGDVIPITLEDLDVLDTALERTRAKVVVFDPIQAFLGAHVDMNRANQVRPVLAGLSRLAAKYGCAVLLVRHLRKMGADRAVHAGLGSIDFSAAARSILLVGRNPQDEKRGVVAHAKSSLGPRGGSQSFRIENNRFDWTGPSDVTADELAAPVPRGRGDPLRQACDFLEQALARGPTHALMLRDEARQAGIAERTLDRAKRELGVRSTRSGGLGRQGRWEWSLPVSPSEGANGRPAKSASSPPCEAGDLSDWPSDPAAA